MVRRLPVLAVLTVMTAAAVVVPAHGQAVTPAGLVAAPLDSAADTARPLRLCAADLLAVPSRSWCLF